MTLGRAGILDLSKWLMYKSHKETSSDHHRYAIQPISMGQEEEPLGFRLPMSQPQRRRVLTTLGVTAAVKGTRMKMKLLWIA